MNEFECKTCGGVHQLSTLIEFPQPDIISQITSGKVDQTLEHLGRNTMLINREYILMECEMKIPIVDRDDDLDYLVWVRMDKADVKKAIGSSKDKESIKIKGKLIHPIPFYDNTEELDVHIGSINFEEISICSIDRSTELRQDFIRGISFDKLIIMLEKYYHMD